MIPNMSWLGILSLLVILSCQAVFGQRREEFAGGNYSVYWEVDNEQEVIYFNITARTLGYVGFGISQIAGMTGADMVIAGVSSNGSSYIQDYYGTKNGPPGLDVVQNWELLDSSEGEGETSLYLSRPLNTCDDQDVAITNGTQYFIWSYGTEDIVRYHGRDNRGGVAVNILDPPMPPVDISQFDVWTVKRDVVLPEAETMYWCSIHRRDPMEGKRHVVGFSPNLVSPEALKHTHHFIVSTCRAPEGVDADELFGKYVDTEGGDCYAPEPVVPLEYCRSVLYVWAIGGKPMMFPETIGYPINERPGEDYVLFEIHYDNPEGLSGVTFEAGIDIYHTDQLREVEAELLMVGHDVGPTHIIPPQSEAFTTVGHCSPQCTQSRLPESGINIFNIMLHSHLAGRKLKLRHFRGNVELPWVANDENYVFDYQQNRPMHQEVNILPGDQLSYECVTSTIGIDGVTLGGLSTRHEMCEAFAWYYPRRNLFVCRSVYPHLDRIMTTFGIQNITGDYFDPTVTAPTEHANKLYSQVLSEYPWYPELKTVLQEELRFQEHYGDCFGFEDERVSVSRQQRLHNTLAKAEELHLVTYPHISEAYAPTQQCVSNTTTSPELPTSPEPTTIITTPETATSNANIMKVLSIQTFLMAVSYFILGN